MSSRNSPSAGCGRSVLAAGGVAALLVSRQRPPRSRNWAAIRSSRPIRSNISKRRSFAAATGRSAWPTWAGGWRSFAPRRSPACRRFKAAPPDCSATTCASSRTIAAGAVRRIRRAGAGDRLVRRGRGLRSFAGRAWIISQGLSGTRADLRRRRAAAASAAVSPLARSPVRTAEHDPPAAPIVAVSPAELAPQYPVAIRWTGSDAADQQFFGRAVSRHGRRAIEYIRAGDIFQVNLAQRLLYPAADDSVALYLRLRRAESGAVRRLFRFGRISDRQRFARAIFESRRSASRNAADQGNAPPHRPARGRSVRRRRTAAKRKGSGRKRDDRRSAAQRFGPRLPAGKRRVSELCRLEVYRVRAASGVGRARRAWPTASTPLDLVRAAFPGGSITGARKFGRCKSSPSWNRPPAGRIAAAWAISASTARLDTNILIRTITAGRGWWQMPVGGGIVAQSDPRARIRRNLAQGGRIAASVGRASVELTVRLVSRDGRLPLLSILHRLI